MASWGEPGAMIDACIHLLPLMTFTCNNDYKHNTCTVLSVQATVQLHEQVNGILEIYTDSYVMKAWIHKAKQ